MVSEKNLAKCAFINTRNTICFRINIVLRLTARSICVDYIKHSMLIRVY